MSDEKKITVAVNYQWQPFCQVVVTLENVEKSKIGAAARFVSDLLVKAYRDMPGQPAPSQAQPGTAPGKEEKISASDLTEIEGAVYNNRGAKHLKFGSVVNVTVRAKDGDYYSCGFWDVEGKKALNLEKGTLVKVAGVYKTNTGEDGKTYQNLDKAILVYPIIEIGDEPAPKTGQGEDDIPF